MNQESIEIFPKVELYPFQAKLWNYIFSENGKRACICWHRRSGKDFCCWHIAIAQCLIKPVNVFYIFPSYTQARKAVWDTISIDGTRFLDFIPRGALLSPPNNLEMKIRFKNGSMLQLVGSEKIDSLRGTNPYLLIFSEYAMSNENAWAYLSPILSRNQGVAIFESTPLGRNHFYNMFEKAKTLPDWYVDLQTVEDTGLVSKEVIERERKEGLISEDKIRQEYFCDFSLGQEGSFYSKLVQKAREEGRIGFVNYDVNLPVHTAWDLGWNDSTSIVFFQVGKADSSIRFIDCYENNFQNMAFYVKVVKDKPYMYGTHFAPQDSKSKSLATGLSSLDVASSLGLEFTLIPSNTPLLEQIENVKTLFSNFFIDEKKCSRLINCMDNYRRKYDEKLKVYGQQPLHDEFSHMCSALSYACLGTKYYLNGVRNEADRFNQAFNKFFPILD